MKPMIKSKTVWFNLIIAAAAFFPQLKEVVTPEMLNQLFVVVTLFGNLLLRKATKEPVGGLLK